jgi:CRP-like cAMP-binding protein
MNSNLLSVSIIEYNKIPLPHNCVKPSEYANAIYPITNETAKAMDEYSFFCSIPKGKTILKAGEICPYVFIVCKGALRGFVKDGNKDITSWITVDNEMVSSISSFFMQLPSFENIQAIEACELIGLSYHHLEMIYTRFPEMNIVGRKLLEKYYRDAEERAYISRLSNAADKYNHLLNTKPNLINRIPQKYIASFLGIRIETLSRLRSKLSQGK